MDVFFWAIAPRVVFWTRFEANFRLGGNRRPLFLNGLTSPRVPGQLRILRISIPADVRKFRCRYPRWRYAPCSAHGGSRSGCRRGLYSAARFQGGSSPCALNRVLFKTPITNLPRSPRGGQDLNWNLRFNNWTRFSSMGSVLTHAEVVT